MGTAHYSHALTPILPHSSAPSLHHPATPSLCLFPGIIRPGQAVCRLPPAARFSEADVPSHFSTIGFPTDSPEDFERIALEAAEHGETIPVADGSYIRWRAGAGAELWVQLDRERNIIGLLPHFSGQGVMVVGLTERITGPDSTDLEGAFHGWANPASDDPANGDFPFVFDSPDFARHAGLGLPLTVDVQLAAFAHDLTAYPDEEAYYDGQTSDMKFAAESFFPAGLFKAGEEAGPPEAFALFSGTVLRAARVTNPATGHSFEWALVRTLGGEFDVVADPAVLTGELVECGVVQGYFWLSGRVMVRS
jgi:hypothetical protein